MTRSFAALRNLFAGYDRRALRPEQTILNPLIQCPDLLRLQRTARRHLQLGIGIVDSRTENAALRAPWHADYTALAPSQHGFPRVEPQATFRRAAMTAVAVIDENRPHFGLEKL